MLRVCILSIALAGSAWVGNDSKVAATAINALGLDLLRQQATTGKNSALSPYSIQIALGMVYAGAEGETRSQMASALRYAGADPGGAFADLQQEWAATIERSTAPGKSPKESGQGEVPIQLTVANRLFGKTGFAFRPNYLALLKKEYGAPLEVVDFGKNPAAEAGKINAWVANRTLGRIRDLIPPDGISDLTRLILVNAVYFKGRWAEPFDAAKTLPRWPFYQATGGQPIWMPTMVQETEFGYAREKGLTMVTLPYVGDELQFLILLPDAPDGLPALEGKLTPDFLIHCANLPTARIRIWLPKFKLAPPTMDLSESLRALGMKSAFNVPDGSADFGGMAELRPGESLFISSVLHKTFIAIDEESTEAASATAAMVGFGAAPEPPKLQALVHVNHPFFFAVQHRASGACLFLGQMTGRP